MLLQPLSPEPADITILGNGLTALSMSLALADCPARIRLISGAREAEYAPPTGGLDRAIALGARSVAWFRRLGIEFNRHEAAAIRQVLVSDRGWPGAVRIDAEEAQLDALGLVVRESVLHRKLRARLASLPTVEQIQGEADHLSRFGHAAELWVTTAGEERTYRTRLLILAEGRAGKLAEQAGFFTSQLDYGQVALTAEVTTSIAHGNRAFERFTARGPVALLPLVEPRRWYLVWCQPSGRVESLAQDQERLRGRLQEVLGYRAGRIQTLEQLSTWPLSRVLRRPLARGRVALVGNLAHTLHPVAGQGFNLALRDVSALAREIANALSGGGDPGSRAVLNNYRLARRADHRSTTLFTDWLPRLFQSHFPPVVVGRNAGLMLLELAPGCKAGFARGAMGWGREPLSGPGGVG